MANTIRLKQGTGSDPSASDLVLGEPAIRTDTGEIFLKKDDGSIAKVAGGIDDGDKGDITVSNDGATFTIDNSAITTGKLNNSAVTFAKLQDISQNIIVGRVSSGSGQIQSLTAANVRTIINVEDGATADQTASEILTLIKTVDGSGSGLDADLLDGSTGADYLNASNLSSGSVPAARLDTATTQSAGNNSTKIATTAYTDTAISNLINGAPAALDTLNELAAAMNDDAAFSTTVTNSLATKLPLAGGQITGNITCSGSQTFDGRDLSVDGSKLDGIESGATADQSASEILTLIKTVDGAGSGLDADTLDGVNSTIFARIDGTDMGAATLRINDADFIVQDGTDTVSNFIWRDQSADKLYLGTANAVITPRSSVIPNADSTYNIGSSSVRWANGYFDTLHGDGSNLTNLPSQTDNNFTNSDHSKLDGIESGATADQSASEILTLIKTVDGSGSGLDADTLDGVSSGSFARKDGTNMGATTFEVNDADFIVKDDTDSTTHYIWRDHSANTLYLGTANAVVTARSNIIPSVDSNYNVGTHSARWSNGYFDSIHGEGSNITGVNATTLDSIDSGSFLRSDAADTASSDITFSGGAGAATIAAGSDIRFPVGTWTGDPGATPKIQGHGNALYICGGTSGIRFREDGTDRWHIDGSGHLTPATDSNYNIGSNGTRVSNGYFDTLYGDGSNLTNLPSQTDNNFTTTLKNKLDGIAASATNVTNNNQLTNGAGYTTYTANQAVNTGSQPTFLDVYTNGWFRNNQSGEGMYNQANGMHWYSGSAGYMDIGGGQTGQGIRCRDNHNGTLRGYFYYDTSSKIGILDGDGNWAVQVDKDVSVNFRVNSTVELTVLPDTVRCEGAFFENNQTVAANKTISDGYNAMSAGPITVNNSVTVTVGSGEVWTII